MAQFYQVAGTQLALPDEARVDLAYTYVYTMSPASAPALSTHTVPGFVIEIPVAAFFLAQTDATVKNRAPEMAVQDALANYLTNPVAAAALTASLTYSYSFNVGSGAAYGPIVTNNVIGFPAVMCLPTYTITLGLGFSAAGDVVNNLSLTVIRIPTGPALAVASVLTPTPLIA